MDVFTVQVGFTSTRPVQPDQHTAWVQVAADTEQQAHLAAAQMVAGWPHAEMVTSTTTLEVKV